MKFTSISAVFMISIIISFGFAGPSSADLDDEPDELFNNDSLYDIPQHSEDSFVNKPASRQEKISLDLKGMDIVDVIKMISQRSGYNIIIGKNVSGKVTMFLKDVDIWEAFEIILSANNLAYEIQGGIIYIMTDKDYELIYGDKFNDE